jgi:hypothetical protein
VPSPEDLIFGYGPEATQILAGLPVCASTVIARLTGHYEMTHELLDKIYRQQISATFPSNSEYRYGFKQSIRREFLCFPYILPGTTRNIMFGNPFLISVALALIRDFSAVYFEREEQAVILNGMRMVGTLFEKNGLTFVVSEAIFCAVIYISVLVGVIAESGDALSVVVGDDHSLMSCRQSSEYGACLAQIPGILKTPTGDLGELFVEVTVRNVDLVLTRCGRALNTVGKGDQYIRIFPDFNIDELMLITLVLMERDDVFFFVSNSSFSPCYIEFPVELFEESE